MRWAPMASERVTVGRRPSGHEGDGHAHGEQEPVARRRAHEEGEPEEAGADADGDQRPRCARSDRARGPAGCGGRSTSAVSRAIPASRVAAPVRRPRPRSPPPRRRCRRARGRSTDGETGTLSPVSIDSSTRTPLASTITPVGGDPVAGGEEEQVARHHLAGVDGERVAVSPHGDPRREQLPQELGRPFGSPLLHEGEDPVDDDDDDDRHAELGQAGDEGQHRGHPEHQGEEVHELGRRGRGARSALAGWGGRSAPTPRAAGWPRRR